MGNNCSVPKQENKLSILQQSYLKWATSKSQVSAKGYVKLPLLLENVLKLQNLNHLQDSTNTRTPSSIHTQNKSQKKQPKYGFIIG